MIRIKAVRKKKVIITFILSIILFYFFSNILIATNKVNLYINKQFILKEITSSSLIEEHFLKSHIDSVLPIIKASKGSKGNIISDDRDIRWLTEFVTGFDIKNPMTIMSSQILLMKNYEDKLVCALGTGAESSVWNPNSGEYNNQHNLIPSAEDKNSENSDMDKGDIEDNSEKERSKNITNNTKINTTGCEYAEGIYVKNEAKKQINISKLFSEDLKINIADKGPQVLILHTHTSESYTPSAKYNYVPSDPDRTEDSKYNVVRVGEEIAKELKNKGISVVHDRTIHDYPSYNGSYKAALKTIESQLKKNPSIKIVLDIHRDAFLYPDGKKLTFVTDVNNEKAAQVMIVSGTDAGGLTHNNWKENFKLALRLQKKLTESNPNLARPVALVPYRYNQHTSYGSLIIEVGAHGNTLDQALVSSKYIAKAVSEVIKDIKK